MKLSLVKTLVLSCTIIFLVSIANAQGNNGRGKCMEPFGISFYAVKGGYEDEWLELYMKWHYPLMQYALDNGTILQHKLFVPDGHSIGEQWTFAGIHSIKLRKKDTISGSSHSAGPTSRPSSRPCASIRIVVGRPTVRSAVIESMVWSTYILRLVTPISS